MIEVNTKKFNEAIKKFLLYDVSLLEKKLETTHKSLGNITNTDTLEITKQITELEVYINLL